MDVYVTFIQIANWLKIQRLIKLTLVLNGINLEYKKT